ncbi:aminotransferase class III-fold pyridoxal phosphate-dependent enzyme [Opitutus sp. GAS368]|uniref:aminotransferase class III-fold pyridoxal phosphate-dependent enzyme n=1 Tax=Opitutus sp. GAS368 TaxID=1882749 RepID=UPI000879B10A|nr:aminotransferase class III-fold pyridoxal phosphate-dependent enzyme [Opitutus sp. GAS368]SDS48242.1 glutamate-1-semialdehyde 2,1-aminomutase [Opitutus sp. GAS368]
MKYVDTLTPRDRELAVTGLAGFLPSEIYDIHVHPYHAAHFPAGEWAFLGGKPALGCADHRAALQRYMPVTTIHGLYFGMPRRAADRPAMNDWVAGEVSGHGTPLSRALMVASPADNPAEVAAALRSGRFCGLKVYHCYADRPDTMHATIEEFAPEWMWEILHEVRGVLLLHIVRDGAMEDPGNQASLRRLCRAYPQARLILAHIARSFSYRNARHGLHAIADLDNAFVDTSAICEAEAFRAALRTLGPRRVLWGSDYAVSELRGRCVTTGSLFFWLHPELIRSEHQAPTNSDMTLVGIESLLSLREACEDTGLTRGDLDDIFLRNALRTLAPHLPAAAVAPSSTGTELWQRARTVISGGTGLLSKRAEMFDAKSWPAYFSRCAGSEVWDLSDRRYLDFAGGVGAILLGYADPDVTAAVQRRLALGTYCSLVNPQEVELAETLLALHPWAGKVRYARGGGDAMTMAVRIARAATGRSGVAFCGYHGWHDWYLAANLGETDALNGHLLPGLEPKGVPRELKGTSVPFRYNDLASLEAALAQLGGNLAAVVMEPMRSQAPKDDFIAKVAARCRAAGGVFVVDEVTSGLRYGFPGAMARFGLEPDLAVYAKAMSNGFPFGTVVGREAIMAAADGSFISSSYWTDGVGPAAALAVLEKVRRLRVHEVVWARGELLQAGLKAIATSLPACRLIVAGMPATPTMNFDLGADAPLAQALYVRKMRERGFLVSSYYYVMLAHDEPKIEQLLRAAGETMGEIAAVITKGTLAEESGVARGLRGFARLA